jgi:hypothetical protein
VREQGSRLLLREKRRPLRSIALRYETVTDGMACICGITGIEGQEIKLGPDTPPYEIFLKMDFILKITYVEKAPNDV